MPMSESDRVHFEHQEADQYADEYIQTIQNQIIKRGLILNGAIEEFNDFRQLPKGDNRGAAAWDFAFTLLTTAVPMLKLGPFVQKLHERATTAVALASQAGLPARAARAVKAGTAAVRKAGTAVAAVETGAKAKETHDKLVESAKKMRGTAADGLEAHKARRPIYELIRDLDLATEAWATAARAELLEYRNRLDGRPTRPGTLLAYMTELLPPVPQPFTRPELDQVWNLYLWYMLGEHVKAEVKLNLVYTQWGADGPETRDRRYYSGLNDTQERRLVELFGFGTPRGRFFHMPSFDSVGAFYEYHGVRTVVTRHRGPGLGALKDV